MPPGVLVVALVRLIIMVTFPQKHVQSIKRLCSLSMQERPRDAEKRLELSGAAHNFGGVCEPARLPPTASACT